jgi:hypothetical protein
MHAAIGNGAILAWPSERDKAKPFAFAISACLCYKKHLQRR